MQSPRRSTTLRRYGLALPTDWIGYNICRGRPTELSKVTDPSNVFYILGARDLLGTM
jgi:hypothetical protein